MNLLSFVLKRARRHWQLLATLSLGVLFATALLASGPVLVNTVVEFGLRRRLLSAEVLEGNVRLEAHAFIPGENPEANYEATDAAIRQAIERHLAPYVDAVVPTSETFWLLPWVGEELLADQRLNLRAYGGRVDNADDEELITRLELVAGRWPEQGALDAENRVVAGVISEAMAQAYELAPGDRLPLSDDGEAEQPSVWLEVSGIARPRDATDSFWFGAFSPFFVGSQTNWVAEYGVLVPAGDFFAAAEIFIPDGRPTPAWNVVIDPAAIQVADLTTLRGSLEALRDDLPGVAGSPRMQTGLDEVLERFAAQATAVRAPLLLLTIEIVLLALYYVTMIAALSIRQVEREFAVLTSRGMTRRQLFQIQSLEALLIGLVAFLSGPVLGATLVRSLALVGPLADVGQVTWPLSVDTLAWLAAGVGALASILGLLLPAGLGLRRSIVSYQQGVVRAARQSWWQRLYLDVFLLAGGLVLLWRLQVYGSIVGGSATRPRVDWLLLLAPVALLLGSGTILLRLFPPLLQLLSRLVSAGRGLPAVLALRQIARNPAHVTRLVLLLTLAMALGILSTGLNATLDRSETERAAYAAGGDLRLVSRRSILLDDVLERVPESETITSVWREQGSVDLGRPYGGLDILALEPERFGAVASFRDDFATQPVPQLLQELVLEDAVRQLVTPLPGRPERLGVWVWTPADGAGEVNFRQFVRGDSDLDRIGINAKIQTAQGQHVTLELLPEETGGYPEDGWRYFETELNRFADESYPLSLHSLWIQNRIRQPGGNSFSAGIKLALDDVTVAEAGTETIVEGFEELTRIWQVDVVSTDTVPEFSGAHSGRARLGIEHFFPPRGSIGLSLANIEAPEAVPALVSSTFIAETGAVIGEIVPVRMRLGEEVPFLIAGEVSYFPTMYETLPAGFLVTAIDPLLDRLNRLSQRSMNANEVLIAVAGDSTAGSLSAAAQVPNVAQVTGVEALRTAFKADPMALGLRSVTFFGYVVTTLLSLIGFATYFYLSASGRAATYGVLRSIGLSPRQLYTTLALEQMILIFFGLLVGTLLGVVLNQITLAGLPITLSEQAPVPPFRPESDWWAVGRIYLWLAIAFLLTLGLATWLLYRHRLHRVLRIGEE